MITTSRRVALEQCSAAARGAGVASGRVHRIRPARGVKAVDLILPAVAAIVISCLAAFWSPGGSTPGSRIAPTGPPKAESPAVGPAPSIGPVAVSLDGSARAVVATGRS